MQENRPEIRNLQYLRSKLHTIDPRLIRTYMSTSSDASSTNSNKSNLEFLEITRAHGQKATLEPNSSGSRRSMLLRSKKDNVEAAKRKLKNMLLRTRKRNNSNLEDQRKQNLKKIIWASLGLRNWKAYPLPHLCTGEKNQEVKILRHPKTSSSLVMVLSWLQIGSLSSSTANQRAAQKYFWALGCQDLYFLNSDTCTYLYISKYVLCTKKEVILWQSSLKFWVTNFHLLNTFL